jgi:hypothetical protein
MKKCSKCLNEVQLFLFHVKKSSPDGYNDVCKECKKGINSLFYEKNRNSKLLYQKEYRNINKEKVDSYKKEYNKTYSPLYYSLNKEKKLKYNANYQSDRLKNDVNYKLTKLLRTRFHHALINGKKMKSILHLLGCAVVEYRQHLEQQFKPEMTWENHGTIWEIDHIKPCASFDLTNIEQQKQCFHYSNLQPLFKTSEIAKNFGYINEIGNRNKGDN